MCGFLNVYSTKKDSAHAEVKVCAGGKPLDAVGSDILGLFMVIQWY